MAESQIASGNEKTRFLKKVHREYVRGGKFEKYIGSSETDIIQTNRDLAKVSIPLIGKLSGNGVKGGQALSGSEENLSNYDFVCNPTHIRNGVKITDEEDEKTEFSLFQEARPALMNWAMERKRDEIIQAMGAIEAAGTYYNYGGTLGGTNITAASAANFDTWNTNNQDRILYGAAKSNLSVGDHTASLANIDTTNDKINAKMVSLAKRMAKNAAPKIRPVTPGAGDNETSILFVGSYSMRDLREDLDVKHQNAMQRGKQNPLWSGDDLFYDGVIIHEVPEIDDFIDGTYESAESFSGIWGAGSADDLRTAGASSSRVAPAFLCGAQALCFLIGKLPSFKREKNDDYGFLKGVGIQMKHEIKKTFYNNKQHGLVTVFHSSTPDN